MTDNLRTASVNEVEQALPDDPEMIKNGTATLHFQGEAWIDERARDTEQYHRYEVPLTELRTEDGEWVINERGSHGHYIDANPESHANVPKWVQYWKGPFRLQVETINLGDNKQSEAQSDEQQSSEESGIGRDWDGMCDQCRNYHHNLVFFRTADFFLCLECLEEGLSTGGES